MTPLEIRQYFREMAGRDQVGHAFILEGDSGEGWRKLAEEFAAVSVLSGVSERESSRYYPGDA